MAVITIVSGIPGAGKTTVSRLLAQEWPRSVHLEGDRIGEEFIGCGLLHPGGEPVDDSDAQLLLRRRNIALLADSFGSAGNDDLLQWADQPGLRLDTSDEDAAKTLWTFVSAGTRRWSPAEAARHAVCGR